MVFVGERTKNYFLKWTPLVISKYRVKYLNIFSYLKKSIYPFSSICMIASSAEKIIPIGNNMPIGMIHIYTFSKTCFTAAAKYN